MLLTQAGFVFVGFILCISGVQEKENSICALKGSALHLPCSDKRPTSSMKWYTVHWDGSVYVKTEIPADGNRFTYNASEQSNFTLTISDLRESDAKFYCCSENRIPELCWRNNTQVQVADLQVKVIPTSDEQRVTLVCGTSCRLTQNPRAYIWYKNGEVLYQDWSPWYQHLVSSEEADRYSCAIEGYEDFRAPEVSVDSITPTCITVTYAKGRMCSVQNKSEDERCTITFPKEVHIQRSIILKKYNAFTCDSSCNVTEAQHKYRWYWNNVLYSDCEDQHITVYRSNQETISCAVKGLEYLHSDDLCLKRDTCWSKKYVRKRICVLEGFSVTIRCKYLQPYHTTYSNNLWYKRKGPGVDDVEMVAEHADRVKFDDMRQSHSLIINNLVKNDSGEYIFSLSYDLCKEFDADDGAMLIVTGLRVMMSPSAVVTEGETATLTCSTSCPLTDGATYSWYFNSQLLTSPEDQNKRLVLDPVGSQHAGNYSCAVRTDVPQNMSSPGEALTVKPRKKSVLIMNLLKLVIFSLTLPAALLYLLMRKKKSQTLSAQPKDNSQTRQNELLYESIPLTTINRAAQMQPAEIQDDTA